MKKVLSLLAICSSACVSVSQQGVKDKSINNDVKPSSIDTRFKEAKKPFTYLRADKMKVLDGMEKDYLEIENQWKEIHEKLMSEGKRLSWSVWKPKDNNLGYDYVTVQTFDSLDSMDAIVVVQSSNCNEGRRNKMSRDPRITTSLTFGMLSIHACKDSFGCFSTTLGELSAKLTALTDEDIEKLKTDSNPLSVNDAKAKTQTNKKLTHK